MVLLGECCFLDPSSYLERREEFMNIYICGRIQCAGINAMDEIRHCGERASKGNPKEDIFFLSEN